MDEIKFGADGLVPVVAADHVTGAVLMLAYANKEAIQISIATKKMTYWSRSRNELWVKGATSGNTQKLVSLHLDCDNDAILARVIQSGPACHTGAGNCWKQSEVAGFLGELQALCVARKRTGAGYTGKLVRDSELVSAKIIEEAKEVAAVIRGEDNEDSLEHEAADLLYHLTAGLAGAGVSMESVLRELAKRHGIE